MGQRKHKTVLFLCTGTYYRGRFAEVLFNSVAGKMGLAWRASSKGLALERGVNNVGPMAASAVQALEALGIRAADAVDLKRRGFKDDGDDDQQLDQRKPLPLPHGRSPGREPALFPRKGGRGF